MRHAQLPGGGGCDQGEAVQADIRLTPCVESVCFQLLETTFLSTRWLQMSTCTPYTKGEMGIGFEVRQRCKLTSPRP